MHPLWASACAARRSRLSGMVNARHSRFDLTVMGRSVSNASTDTRHAFAPDKRTRPVHTYLDAKSMAKALRQSLAARSIALSHSDCLEIVSQQFGLADWNTMAARIAAAPTGDALRLPRDWSMTNQTDQRYYRGGLDPEEPGTALVESRFKLGSGVDLSGDHFASLMQSVRADPFKGDRVELTASLRTEDADAASIWMRVDGSPGHVLRFDNMMKRKDDGALHGTRGWISRSVVLDVPEDAISIHYGVLLQGYGRVWARSFKISSVGQDVPVTAQRHYLDRPSNLDFSDAN
ncbi:MAG: glyoxalase superfamily protein [Mesorhizobium sp.]